MKQRSWKGWSVGACAMVAIVLNGVPALAQTAITTEVDLGKSQILTLKQPIAKVSVAAQEIADVEVLSPTHLLLFGKSVGTTNLILFDDAGQPTFFDVVVRRPIESRQVLLQVRVAEVDRNAVKELGINFVTIQKGSAGTFGGGSFSGNVSPPGGTSGAPDVSIANSISAALVSVTGHNSSSVVIKALIDKGLLTTLAEPNMVVRSGEKGNFLVGGRIPIPQVVSGGGGATSVTYEPYGVQLNVAPTVYEDGRISLAIDPASVSALDYANAVIISGGTIPAFTSREVRTVVDLQEHETLILAGLLSNQESRDISKFPILGDIPILGALFRSSRFQKNQTDLMIFITPQIVQPLAPETAVAYPGKGGPTNGQLKEFQWMPGVSDTINLPK